MAVRTVYENVKLQRKFYSVEKTGFVTVGQVIYSMVNDMLSTGAFSVVNVVFVESTTKNTSFSGWPVAERLYEIVDRGKGYTIGDTLVAYEPNASVTQPYAITVTQVDAVDGTLRDWTVKAGTKYITVDTVQPRPLVYASSANPLEPDLLRSKAQFVNRMQINNSSGITPVSGRARKTVATDPAVGTSAWHTSWNTNYGVNGQGGSLGTTWPTAANSIWSWQTDATNLTGAGAVRYEGMEIFVDESTALAGTNIPPGTRITSKIAFDVVTSSTFFAVGSGRENITRAWYFKLNQSANIAAGETVLLRGAGATVRNNNLTVPDTYKVVLETTGAVDPLSDPAGVYGNVVASLSSGNILTVKSLTSTNNFEKVIWPGHRVTSALTVGTVNGVVYVKDVISANTSWAKVTLTSNQSIANGEQLHFVFEDIQQWRLMFDVKDPQTADVYAATDLQINDKAVVSKIWNSTGTTVTDLAGLIGNAPTGGTSPDVKPNTNNTDEGFVNRAKRVGATGGKVGNPEAYPINYTMTITDRGIFFGLWESNWSVMQKAKSADDVYFNWVLIQRPVDRLTGKIVTTGRCPVFCINSVGHKYWKFIVREADAPHPTQGDPNTVSYKLKTVGTTLSDWEIDDQKTPYRTPADTHSEDSFAIINSTKQIALTEDSKFLISFLHNLTTPRFRYSSELDIVGQTSADVCMATNDVSLAAYNESGPRTYRAMPANNSYNTGLRITVLKDIPDKPDNPLT